MKEALKEEDWGGPVQHPLHLHHTQSPPLGHTHRGRSRHSQRGGHHGREKRGGDGEVWREEFGGGELKQKVSQL
ncbi:hypothetical protein Pcinc_026756 [Petrolisthes cinctipes]|uniref:Uncharacterized protein n=1 Tax=Petrolisthes cinctipes TaxID=88211 RepID=A0AAE1F6I7_PETCI|nr:hypothetical protein Pcinc_026756 [Petrolisthes cinctipes]